MKAKIKYLLQLNYLNRFFEIHIQIQRIKAILVYDSIR